MQKKIKKKAAAAAANVRARQREIDFEDYDDVLSCEKCPNCEACKMGKMTGCIVQNEKRQDVDWFMQYWNQKRIEHNARLPELLLLTRQQTDRQDMERMLCECS